MIRWHQRKSNIRYGAACNADVTQGQKFKEGDVLEIESVIAHRPGEKGIAICCLSPLYFDVMSSDKAIRLLNEKLIDEQAETEIDPLADLGLE